MEPDFETIFAIYAVPAFFGVLMLATLFLGQLLGDPVLQTGLVALFFVLACWGSAAVSLYTGFFLYKRPFGWFAHITHRSEAELAYLIHVVGMLVGPFVGGAFVYLGVTGFV